MDKPKEYGDIYWLDDESYQKAVGQLRLQINGALRPLRLYGQEVYCNQAADAIIKLCEDFSLRVRGVEHIIHSPEAQRLAEIDSL